VFGADSLKNGAAFLALEQHSSDTHKEYLRHTSWLFHPQRRSSRKAASVCLALAITTLAQYLVKPDLPRVHAPVRRQSTNGDVFEVGSGGDY